ncbi:MAG TPA: GxxExxY protein [Pyrinomonadaceae bacterium]
MNTNPHKLEILALCNIIRQTSFEIHKYLRAGHRELIYENALAHRLRKRGIAVEQQQQVKVFDEDGTLLGFFRTDLMIDDRLICEIKGVRALDDEHIAQILGYLRASRIEHGLLINFGAARLEVKKYILN